LPSRVGLTLFAPLYYDIKSDCIDKTVCKVVLSDCHRIFSIYISFWTEIWFCSFRQSWRYSECPMTRATPIHKLHCFRGIFRLVFGRCSSNGEALPVTTCSTQHARIDGTHQIVISSLCAVSSQENTRWPKSNENVSFSASDKLSHI
jgi:hypothetical protein